MPFSEIALRKILTIFDLKPGRQITKLKGIINQDERKLSGGEGGGGDFHVPFWRDAKDHISGSLDLTERSRQRVKESKSRTRLYPLLSQGFLAWWDEKRRWSNEGYTLVPDKVSGRYPVPETNGVIKVDNFIVLRRGDVDTRLVYPYFSEDPVLSLDNARLGIWVIKQAVQQYALEDIRILDVLRGRQFSVVDAKMTGSEEADFQRKYLAIKTINDKL